MRGGGVLISWYDLGGYSFNDEKIKDVSGTCEQTIRDEGPAGTGTLRASKRYEVHLIFSFSIWGA